MIDSIRQTQISSPMTTAAAILRCVCWWYFLYFSTGPCCLVVKHLKEPRPCRIGDTFRQTMVSHHIQDHQIFQTDNAILFDQYCAFLMRKVSPFISNALVYAGNCFLTGFSFLSSFSCLAQFLLLFGQCF